MISLSSAYNLFEYLKDDMRMGGIFVFFFRKKEKRLDMADVNVYTAARLADLAASLSCLAKSFTEEIDGQHLTREDGAAAMQTAAAMVCGSCSRCNLYQDSAREDSYYLYYLLRAFEVHGAVRMEDMPLLFRQTCFHKEKYLSQLNSSLGRATMNLSWKNRFLESRDAVVVQFRELASIIEEFSRQMERAADVSIILTWHKVNDDIQDHGFWTGLPHRIVRLLFGRAYRRAAQACPIFDAQVRQGMERLSQLEQEQSPRLDEVAHQFAGILAAAAPTQADQTRNRIREQLLYHVGRWIYLMDAWDDLEEDEAGGRYNPLSTRFQGEAKKEREYVSTTCTHSVRLAANAAQLLDLGEWDEVLSNILCVGLPAVQSAVLDGRWKELKKLHKGRYTHERSV